MRRSLPSSRLLPACALWAPPATAQVNTATIFRAVTDPTGASSAQAEVTATNQQTGGVRKTAADAAGEFTLTFLPPGRHTILVRAAGFKEKRTIGLELVAGRRLRLRFARGLGELTESVTVSAATPVVNTTGAQQDHLVAAPRTQEPPAINRGWTVLPQPSAGLVVSNNAVAMNGLPPDGFRFTADGANASGSSESEAPTSLGYVKAVSLEAIREISVVSGIAPTETGPAMSGNVNVITSSGTNQFHGSLFANNRAENFAARNRFLTSRAPLAFNQFGGFLGGPILRNKLFFFGVYEGYRSRAFALVSGNVPTLESREMVIGAVPATKAFFATLPLPNTSYASGAVTGFYQSAGSSKEDSDHYSVRGNSYVRDTDLLSVRFTQDWPFRFTPRVSPANPRSFDVKTKKAVVNYVRSSATWSAETRYGYNRFERVRPDHISSLGASAIVGNLGFSNSGELMENLGTNFSLEDVVAMHRGRHSIKYGALREKYTSGRNNETVPEFRFAIVADLPADRPTQITISFGVGPYTLYNWVLGRFLQNDDRVTDRLILNLGLRYDYFAVPKEKNKRLFNRTGPFGIGPFTDPDSIYDANYPDFAARIGRNAPRAPGFWNLDPALARNFQFKERRRLPVRGGLFNALNHTNFSGISTSINAADFGRFTSTRGARLVRFNARLCF